MKRSKPIQRKKRLSPVSKRRKAEMREYAILRADFLRDRKICEVWCQLNHWMRDPHKKDTYQNLLSGEEVDSVWLWTNLRAPLATDVHHTKKRGKHYLDVDSWMAVCRENHQKIHDNPAWARQNGFLR